MRGPRPTTLLRLSRVVDRSEQRRVPTCLWPSACGGDLVPGASSPLLTGPAAAAAAQPLTRSTEGRCPRAVRGRGSVPQRLGGAAPAAGQRPCPLLPQSSAPAPGGVTAARGRRKLVGCREQAERGAGRGVQADTPAGVLGQRHCPLHVLGELGSAQARHSGRGAGWGVGRGRGRGGGGAEEGRSRSGTWHPGLAVLSKVGAGSPCHLATVPGGQWSVANRMFSSTAPAPAPRASFAGRSPGCDGSHSIPGCLCFWGCAGTALGTRGATAQKGMLRHPALGGPPLSPGTKRASAFSTRSRLPRTWVWCPGCSCTWGHARPVPGSGGTLAAPASPPRMPPPRSSHSALPQRCPHSGSRCPATCLHLLSRTQRVSV